MHAGIPSGWSAWDTGDGRAAEICAADAEPHDMAQDASAGPVGPQQHAFAGAVHPSRGAQSAAGAHASAAAATLTMTRPWRSRVII